MTDNNGGALLRLRLAEPARQLDLAGAVNNWHHARICVQCEGGGELATDPRTAGWVRGALGRQLEAAASAPARAGLPCPWQPPCLLDQLFGTHGKLKGGLEIPRPYVTATSAVDGDLVAEVTLFGFAADLAEAAAEALVRGLRQGLNVNGCYRTLECRYRTITTHDRVEMLPSGVPLLVRMETPLAIRRGDHSIAAEFGDLVSSLTLRIEAMARWQDTALSAPWAELIAMGRAMATHTIPGAPPPCQWHRGSRRQDRTIPVDGVLKQWLVDSPPPDLLRLLILGQTTHCGGRTTVGLGRYSVQPLI